MEDGQAAGLACVCGYENFERVVVERTAGVPIVTDFVACVGCRTMFWAPKQRSAELAPRSPEPPPRREQAPAGTGTVSWVPKDVPGRPIINRPEPLPRVRTAEEEAEHQAILRAAKLAGKSKRKGLR